MVAHDPEALMVKASRRAAEVRWPERLSFAGSAKDRKIRYTDASGATGRMKTDEFERNP